MKKVVLLYLFLFSFYLSFAQLGDFNLDSLSQSSHRRTYETQPANPQLVGGPVKHLFIGKNYRPEWRQPVTAPVLNFQYDLGGIKIEEEGGGRQTRSLDIKDASGRKWALRSVRKFPVNVVEPALQGTIAEKIVSDGISASYPYSVLSVGTLAKAANVPYLPNTLVYIPDHPALGELREKYKNMLAFLELRTIGSPGKDAKTYNTYEVVPELFQSGKNTVDQRLALRARLLDNFIMDFDRHEDQWEWVKKDSAGKTFYYPVAKDRDQAFFRANGLLPKIARIFQPTLGQLQGLREKASNIKTFNFVARDFDRSFLHALDEQTWNKEIDDFLSSLTDPVIEDALLRQPKEIHPFHVNSIIETLKNKRQHFKEDMMDYYRFLSRTVSITGSNQQELFTITTEQDGSTNVKVEQLDSAGTVQHTTYQRYFFPSVTKELRIYGLEGNDRFLLRGGETTIKIRLIGGPGEDSFINEGSNNNVLAYDVTFESNTISGEGIKNKFSNDPLTNEYRRLGAQYTIKIPNIGVEITREGGLFLGATLKITTPGFRKEPYATSHYLYATRALNSSSYHFKYNADFIGAGKTDLLIRTEATLPTVRTYFFGFGNNTFYNKQLGREFYLARYHLADFSLQARHKMNNWLQLRVGPVFQYLKLESERNKGNYVSTLYPNGNSQNALYDGLWYGGAEIALEMNRRNHPVFTTQGIHANVYSRLMRGLSENGNDFEQVGGRLSLFTDVLFRRVIVFATSFGADHIYGNFQFPQAQYLGFRQNLRGYRFQRFAGRTRAYNNTELRINLGVRNFYFFKGPFGLLAFHDMGRVWLKGEDSDTIHRGYGGGIWVAPFTKVVVIGTVASSKEEKSWLQVSFGFQF